MGLEFEDITQLFTGDWIGKGHDSLVALRDGNCNSSFLWTDLYQVLEKGQQVPKTDSDDSSMQKVVEGLKRKLEIGMQELYSLNQKVIILINEIAITNTF